MRLAHGDAHDPFVFGTFQQARDGGLREKQTPGYLRLAHSLFVVQAGNPGHQPQLVDACHRSLSYGTVKQGPLDVRGLGDGLLPACVERFPPPGIQVRLEPFVAAHQLGDLFF